MSLQQIRNMLSEELKNLYNRMEFHFEELQSYSQAAYHVVCDLGRNQECHDLRKDGKYSIAKDNFLKMASELKQIEERITKIKEALEQEKDNAKSL